MKPLVFDINCSVDSFNIKVLEITAKKFSHSPLFPINKTVQPHTLTPISNPFIFACVNFCWVTCFELTNVPKEMCRFKKLRNVNKSYNIKYERQQLYL